MLGILGMAKKTKIFGAAIGILLVIMLVLAWQYRAEVRKSAGLLAGMQNAIEANYQQQKAIGELKKERDHLERTLESRSVEQARIEREAARQIFNLEQRLAGLRAEYESVDEFLSLPVPAEFVQWMRERAAGSDQDRGPED